ncbi:DUF3055 domain-containing protein [Neobacillus notoginsengisoli]|uniref:DUF3055 domain-containing protein n=1 Tax=Neobacillus notoginsengisoli TaxID=1578198 RepID=A0A417YEM1_9BACI|nr:DUF3055 domain-containing protein [Neobacillus notoginsengisoli]RHW31124.1 DUF3055 domain-containing protein [Neobacillus notoginsengisoli]
MNQFERLYDEQENVKVRFTGFTTENARYDFGVVYSSLFFGKPLVVCMQTGRSTLLEPKDLDNIDHLQHVFRIGDEEQVIELVEFFHEILPVAPFSTQYD